MANKMLSEVKIVEEFIRKDILPKAQDFHNEILKHADSYSLLYSKWKTKISGMEENSDLFFPTSELHRELEASLSSNKELMDKNILFSLHQLLNNELKKQIETQEQQIILHQLPIHFEAAKTDSARLRFFKTIKRINFSFTAGVYHLFKGKKKEYYWHRKVPLKDLATHYLIYNYLDKILVVTENYIESVGKSFIKLLNLQKEFDSIFTNSIFPFIKEQNIKNYDEAYREFLKNVDQSKSELDKYFDLYSSALITELNNEFQLFTNDFNVIGTIELSRKKYKKKKITKELSNLQKKLDKSIKYYNNFISAVTDRKEYYEDLLWFTSLLISNSYSIDNYGKSFLKESVQPIIRSIDEDIKSSIGQIKKEQADLADRFEKEKDKLRKSIDENLVPALVNILAANSYNTTFNNYSNKLQQNLNEFEKDYAFVKPKNLNYKLKHDQLKKFSPKEIIFPIVIKKIDISAKKIMSDIENKISKMNSVIVSLGRIIEFNIETAKITIVEDNSAKAKSLEIAVDGLTRAANKSEDYYNNLNNLVEEISASFQKEIKDLVEDLIALSNIDRLITIKLQVSKEKAIQEVKDRIYNYYNKTVKWLKWIKTKGLNLFSLSREKIIGISTKVGLSSSQIELSETMIDYLVRVSESMEKLPHVYQRLFSNDQLTDERIFIGRDDETARLNKAIEYWKNNQVSSVMLIGEKGSGTSSLINITLKKQNIDCKIFRKEFNTTIYKEEELLVFLKNMLEINDLATADELVDSLNNFKERRIVIIENIEDLFLRIVDGFDAIKKLMEIITSTSKNVLWITTCNTYAWQYLNKVVNIGDFYIFNIHMKPLNEELVEKIVLSRHNISGYYLDFVPPASIQKQKSFKKLSAIDQQNYLRKNYFDYLTKSANDNIAVALFLWLRSITSFDEENIQITTDLGLDFSFLKKLSDQKLFSLMAIILHDGLSVEENSKIFNVSLKSSHLLFTSMLDDGIIFKVKDNFKVNFQLYKPLINLLKDKNILH
jgi:hypothetical protein